MHKDVKEMGVHYIFITDDLGIASVFPAIKFKLTDQDCQQVSLLYFSLNKQHVFRKELQILERRFLTHLYISYLSQDIEGTRAFPNEEIEAVLNANTMPRMDFILSGNEEFIGKAKSLLTFFDINEVQIQEQFFTE
jgi:ferredoxin-NADP reductase